MPRKRQCKFKESCKAFMAGKECSYAHDRCKFGDHCKDKVACIFTHDSSSSMQSGFASAPRK